MWILFVWLGSSYQVGMFDAKQPALISMTQEFNSESACRSAFAEIKKLNSGELVLRGVCAPKGDAQ